MGFLDLLRKPKFPQSAPHVFSEKPDLVPTWKTGDVILDLYEVKDVFTGGGMGLVYRVNHREWNTELVVKRPRPELFQNEAQAVNFEREAETWVKLGLHLHTVTCYYIRRLDGVPCIFAEFVDGGSLADWVRTGALYVGTPTDVLKRILTTSVQFAWGLYEAHRQGIIHQDIKPGNVLVSIDGTAKLTDFGLARARAETAEESFIANGAEILVTSGGLTPAYCSPEQAARQRLSHKTDLWSWAVSVLEMFIGQPPCREGRTPCGSRAQKLYRVYWDTL